MAFWDDVSRFAGNLTGGWIGESDEERRRKQQQQQQQQAQKRQLALSAAPKVLTPQAQQDYVKKNSPELFKDEPQQGLTNVAKKKEDEKPSDPVGDFVAGAANVGGNLVKGVGGAIDSVIKDPVGEAHKVLQAPFRAGASIAKSLGDKSDYQDNDFKRFFYGTEPIDNLVEQGQQLANLSLDEDQLGRGEQAQINPLAAGLLGTVAAGSDLVPGVGSVKKKVVKGAVDEAEELAAREALDAAEGTASQVGRQATETELRAVNPSLTPEQKLAEIEGAPTGEELAQQIADGGGEPPRTGIDNMTDPSGNPGDKDSLGLQVEAAIRERNRNSENPVESFKNSALREGYDPLADLQRYDDRLRKKNGGKLETERELNYLFGVSQNPESIARQALDTKTPGTGQSVLKVIRKYGEGTPQGNEFVAYLNNKFALDVAQKRGLSPDDANTLVPGETPATLRRNVEAYEARNGSAKKDARTVKEHSDALIDRAIKDGVISKEDGDFVKGYYKDYAPLSRALSENIIRPTITGNVKGSLGRQTILQEIEGSQLPLDTSFATIIDKTTDTVRQGATNRFANEYYRRVTDGDIDADVLVDPDISAAKKQALDLQRQLKESREGLKADIRAARGNQRVDGVKAAQTNKEVVAAAKRYLNENIAPDDLDAKAALASMKDNQLVEVFDALVDNDPTAFKRVSSKYQRGSAKSKALADKLGQLRQQLSENTDASQIVFKEGLEMTQNPATGRQVLKGMRNGEQFAVELPPDLAQGLARAGTSAKKEFGDLVTEAPANIFKTLFTGALNPVFTLVNAAVKNPVVIFTNAKGLSSFGLRPMVDGVRAMTGNSEFHKQLIEAGARPITSTQRAYKPSVNAEVLAAGGSPKAWAKLTVNHPGTGLKQAFNSLDKFGAVLERMQRTGVASGYYRRAKRQGATDSEASAYAAQAYNEVLGDFNRVTQAAKSVEPILLYSGATQAGVRSLVRAWKQRPIETAAKVGAVMTATGAMAYTALSSEEGQEFYQDMRDSGREYVLDNNIIIALPGVASKNPETGEWTGIIKIPVAPDVRPLHRTIQREVFDSVTKQGEVNPQDFAYGAFQYLTGDLANNIMDPATGFLGSNPVVQTGKVLAGVDPRDNSRILTDAQEVQAEREGKGSVKYDTTTPAGEMLGNALGVTPVQGDRLLGQMGFAGKTLQNREGNPISGTVEAIKDQFSGAFGDSDGAKFRKNIDAARKGIADDKQRLLFDSLHQKRTLGAAEARKLGIEPPKDADKSMLDGATKALILLDNQEVLEAEMKLADESKKRGEPVNPLFDRGLLTPEQRRRVLTYRQGKIYNSAGQNDAKDGSDAFTALGLDEQWYDQFRKSEGDFYASISEGDAETTPRTFSGQAKPTPSPELQSKLDYYYTLPKGTGDRKAFLAANPDVTSYWDASEGFTNAERQALGFKPLAEDDGTGGFGRGRSGSGGSESKKSGVAGTLTTFAKDTAGPTRVAGPKQELQDVRKAVRQPRRATKKSTIRITI